MSKKLKPCPFCGSEADLYEDSHRMMPIWHIWCSGCECEMVKAYDAEAEAIAAWNRREMKEGNEMSQRKPLEDRVAALEAQVAMLQEWIRRISENMVARSDQ